MVEYDRLPSGPFGSVPTHQILSMAYEIAIASIATLPSAVSSSAASPHCRLESVGQADNLRAPIGNPIGNRPHLSPVIQFEL